MWDQVPFQLRRGLTLSLVEPGHQETQIRDVGSLLPESQPEATCGQEAHGVSRQTGLTLPLRPQSFYP